MNNARRSTSFAQIRLIALSVICSLGAPITSARQTPFRKASDDGSLLSLQRIVSIPESGYGYRLLKPTRILAATDGTIYVLDYAASAVKIFGPDGRYIKTVGRPGPGPGELDGANDVFLAKGEIGVNCPTRRLVIFFSPEGRYLRTSRMPVFMSQMSADARGFLYGVTFDGTDANAPLLKIVRFLPANGELIEIARRRWKEPAPFTATLTFAVSGGKRIVIGNPEIGFVIQVKSESGELWQEIRKDSSLVRIRPAEIAKMRSLGPIPAIYPKYYEPYYRVFAAEGGIILAEIHDKVVADGMALLSVFDESGRYAGDAAIKRSLDYCWANGNLYSIEDDAEGLPCLSVSAVRWRLPSRPLEEENRRSQQSAGMTTRKKQPT